MAKPLKAPFPYPGGKSRIADYVWTRLGDVQNYIEPFMGSAAVMLRRPAEHFADGYRVETANDVNHYIVNFWRAVVGAPEEVARHADRPVTEADMHAAHKWLVRSASAREFRQRMVEDPFAFDAKIAGYWVHGQCCWIGGAWCFHDTAADKAKMPCIGQECGTGGIGVHGVGGRPQLADAFDIGRGVNAGNEAWKQRPSITQSDGIGWGVNSGGRLDDAENHKRPLLPGGPGDGGRSPVAVGVLPNMLAGTCEARRNWLTAWMQRLADRLRLVRTCYGHWSRVCDSESTLARLGVTGVFLDPPYPTHRSDTGRKSRDGTLYASDKGADLNKLRDEVRDWCVKWGSHGDIRAAVCCYEGDGYESLADHGWTVTEWEAGGGYANQHRAGKGKAANARRERIWFSPNCLSVERKPVSKDLFGDPA